MISFIVAMGKNGVIGKDNKLPWHLPADLKFFKNTTMGHNIVMGRKTYESIGKPLPGRENIILTRDLSYKAEGCTVFHSVEDVLRYAEEKSGETFITGGEEVFKLFISAVDKLYVTKINHEFDGDTFFPSLNWDDFTLVSSEQGIQDGKNRYDYKFEVYEKNR